MSDNEWTKWTARRPDGKDRYYWWRGPTVDYGGLSVRHEFTEQTVMHGMGHSPSELWPKRLSDWNGYQRTVPAELEWREASDAEQRKIEVWPGLNLEPCPFCAKPPTIEWTGTYICAPIWRIDGARIKCVGCGIPQLYASTARLANAVQMWNKRTCPGEDQG